jgi:hypothetical protein
MSVVSVAIRFVGAAAAAVVIATGTAIATNDDGAVGTVVPPSSTKDGGAYIDTLVAFEGMCVGALVDGAGPLGNNDNVEFATRNDGSSSSSLNQQSTLRTL